MTPTYCGRSCGCAIGQCLAEEAVQKAERDAVSAACQSFVHDGAIREALIDWRNCWLCPCTDFESQVPRLLDVTNAALGTAEAK
jgi:hypothetical protein